MKCMKWVNWHESIDMNDLKWRNWNAWTETNELSWMTWNERIEMKELIWMNWDEWIEMNKLKRMNWHEWIEMSDLTWLTWHEGMETNEQWMKWMNTNEWIDTNELTWMNWNEWTETNELTWMICRPHLEKVVRSCQFFLEFYVKSSSRYSLVHILSTSSSKKWSDPVSFWRFFCDQLLDDDVVDRWNEALATVARTLCRPCRPHLRKVVRSCQFFNDFYVKSSSCYSLVHILSTTFPTKARNHGNRDPPAATTDSHFNRKKRGFAPEGVFSREFTRSRSLTRPNILDDDVIGMMMCLTWWLRWWCGCHDGDTASHWQSFVTRKFPSETSSDSVLHI